MNRQLTARDRLQERYRLDMQDLENRLARTEAERQALSARLQQVTTGRNEAFRLVAEAREVARQLVDGAGYQPGCECLTCRLRREHAWLREDCRGLRSPDPEPPEES